MTPLLLCARNMNAQASHIRRRRCRSKRGRQLISRVLRPSVEFLEPRIVLDGHSLGDFYTEGEGAGLSFQELDGFGLVTTYATIIEGGTASSALEGAPSQHGTGEAPARDGFEFNPAFIWDDPEGNLVGWNTQLGGTAPWLIRPELVGQEGAVQDPAYPTRNVPDSAATATSLVTGVKTYRGAIGVDLYEQPVESVLEQAQRLGKATGVVTSVSISHATPAAMMAHQNYRLRRDADYPDLDNSLQQALRETRPTVVLGGGHPIIGHYAHIRPSTLAALRDPADGRYDEWTFVERGPDAADRLAEVAAGIDPEAGQHLVTLYGARGQGGNLPWTTGDGDFASTGTTGRPAWVRPLAEGELTEEFIAREVDENPRLFQLTAAALDVLEEDVDGFWLMVEGGDIDWGMHNNNLDNAVGAVLEFDRAVQTTIDWINMHGGFDENVLIVTADHDHYLTLNDDYPELVATRGLEALSDPDSVIGDAQGNGHFWGPNPDTQFGWGDHTAIPVPAYYQGPPAVMDQFRSLVGQGFEAYGHAVSGVEGMVDQVHLHQVMSTTLAEGRAKNVILMIGDAMGWEITRAAAIAKQVQLEAQVKARLDQNGLLIINGTNRDDTIHVFSENDRVAVTSADQAVPIEVNGRLVDEITSWFITEVRFFGWGGQDQLRAEGLWSGGEPPYKAGDANQDGQFDQLDIVQILQSAKYLTGEPATWEEGDWNGDLVFDQQDIVAALQSGDYLQSANAAHKEDTLAIDHAFAWLAAHGK